MTNLGAIASDTDMATEEAKPVGNGYVEQGTTQTTTSGTLENVTGASFNLTTNVSGRIMAALSIECSVTGAGSTGAWAISINSVDGTEIQRFISAGAEIGAVSIQARSATLAAGTYTVQARHRRAVGGGTINTDLAQLSALFVAT